MMINCTIQSSPCVLCARVCQELSISRASGTNGRVKCNYRIALSLSAMQIYVLAVTACRELKKNETFRQLLKQNGSRICNSICDTNIS